MLLRSSFDNDLTVALVPTGINTGVSIFPWDVVMIRVFGLKANMLTIILTKWHNIRDEENLGNDDNGAGCGKSSFGN